MNRDQEIAQIEAALRRAEEALRRGDPDALAGRFAPLNGSEAQKPETTTDARLKVSAPKSNVK